MHTRFSWQDQNLQAIKQKRLSELSVNGATLMMEISSQWGSSTLKNLKSSKMNPGKISVTGSSMASSTVD